MHGIKYSLPIIGCCILFFQGILYANNTSNKTSTLYRKDSLKAAYYNKISSKLTYENPDSSIGYARMGLEIVKPYSDDTYFMYKKAQLLINIGVAHSIQSNFIKSIKSYMLASQIYDTLAKHFPDDKYYKQALVVCYTNMGVLNYLDKKYDQSLKQYLKTIPLFQYLTNNQQKGQILNNIGIIYLEQKEYATAEDYYQRALTLFEHDSLLRDIAMIYNNIGEVYNKTGRNKEALTYLNKAYKIKMKLKDNYGAEVGLYTIAEVYFSEKEYDSAVFYAKNSLAIAKEMKNKYDMIKTLSLLSKIYAASNRYKEAYSILLSEKELHDRVYNEKNEKQLHELQTKYKTQQKENEILTLKAKEEQNRLKSKLTIAGVGALAAIFFITFLLIYIKRKDEKQRMENELEKKQLKEQELNKEINFKTKQLTTHALNMMQKNKMLQNLKKSIDTIANKAKPEVQESLSQLMKIIETNLKSEKDWEMFRIYFEQIDNSFYSRLTEKYPKLNNNDLHHCALLKLNMNLKETASVLNLSPNTIKSARNRLKKKLFLSSETDLGEFIRTI